MSSSQQVDLAKDASSVLLSQLRLLLHCRDCQCSGTNWNSTAAHCIGTLSSPDLAGGRVIAPTYGRITFESISGEVTQVDVPSSALGHRVEGWAGDVALLTLPSYAGASLPLASFSADLWEPLLIVGANPFLTGLFTSDAEVKGPVGPSGFSVSLEPYCVLMSRDADGTMRHNCQTEQGLAGAPTLVLREGRFFVVGIHAGSVGSANDACSPLSVGTINRGVSLIAK